MKKSTSSMITLAPSKNNSINVLGVKISSTPLKALLRQVRTNIANHQKFYIVTPNPEIVLIAQKDHKLKKILNSALVSLPDGIGLVAASKFLSLKSSANKLLSIPILVFQGAAVGFSIILNPPWLSTEICPIKGRHFFLRLIQIANLKSWKIFLLGGSGGVAEKAARNLSTNYHKISFGFADGPLLGSNARPLDSENSAIEVRCLEKINRFKPHILFIGFGAPKQEKWLYRLYPDLDASCLMVIGGTLEYYAARRKLPPKSLEKLGLEWLFRLVTRSQNLRRILNALVLFPAKVFMSKMNHNY